MFKKLDKYRRLMTTSRRTYCSEVLLNGKYKSVVGLEVHAQILSQSKLFSGAPNDQAAPSNTAVSLFDASTPGTLPRLNRKCVESAVRTAMMLSCTLNPISMFDRKHYFYADSPAGYQITQQRLPLAVDGNISFFVTNVKKPYFKSSKIHQIQLEQDSGKSLHFPGTRTSLLDLNRAGVPLMEIVFEPDLSTGEEAASLLKELSLILTRLDVCTCKFSAMRCDVNVSIHKPGEPLGVRSEVKNISSHRAVAKAIEYEIARHIELKESGQRIVNETRAWDDETNTTIRMRDKEVVQDYRFMPEPNLLPLNLNSIDLDNLRKSLPEIPDSTRDTLKQYNICGQTIEILVIYNKLLDIFLSTASKCREADASLAGHLLKYNVLAACKQLKVNPQECSLTKENFEEVIEMYKEGLINSGLADDVFCEVIKNPTHSARKFVIETDLTVIRDPVELRKLCEESTRRYDKVAKKARRGKESEFFKLAKLTVDLSHKRADLELLKPILTEVLKST